MKALHALLGKCVDYAGLFPPAALDLSQTIRNFTAYRSGEDNWALGRLIVPAAALRVFNPSERGDLKNMPLSVILGTEAEEDLKALLESGLAVDTFESRLSDPAEARRTRSLLRTDASLFLEVPTSGNVDGWISAVSKAGASAKVRTGGITPEAIPCVNAVIEVLECCVRHQVRVKATAGLHHAVRAVHTLTYEPDSPTGVTHGFLNLVLAAAVLQEGGTAEEAAAVLGEMDVTTFALNVADCRWRHRTFTTALIQHVRETFLISFGSCSFTEPVAELSALEAA